MPAKELHALIGVVRRGNMTLYFKRSAQMENYPGVWSLLSGRVTRAEMDDFLEPVTVQPYVDRLSKERLDGTPLKVIRFLTSAYCDKTDHRLFLYMYELDCQDLPSLNPRFYTDVRFMTPDQYQAASANAMCGLCLSMWSRYCVTHGLVDRSFAEAGDLAPRGELYAP